MKKITPGLILAVTALFAAACNNASTAPGNNTNQAANKPATNAAPEANKAANTGTNTNTASNTAATTYPAADTPTNAYKAAYAARKNKDIKALRGMIAKDMEEFFEIFSEGKKGDEAVDEGLRQMCEQPQGPSDDSRNEKITGNTATLEYLNIKGDWHTMDFVKEDGKWKLTIPKGAAKDDGKKN